MIDIITTFDTAFVHIMQSIGSYWVPVAMFLSDIVGSTHYLAPALIIALFAIGKKRIAIELAVVFVTASALTYGLKELISAPRPYWVDADIVGYIVEDDFGMPSGHALISLATLGWVWLRHPRSWILSASLPALLILIGLSRVYLGVHYPSQIVVGWGIAVALISILYVIDRRYFRRRDQFVRSSVKLR